MCNTLCEVLCEILQPLIFAQIVKQCNRCFKSEFYAAISSPLSDYQACGFAILVVIAVLPR